MSASEVPPNPFWYAKPTAALTSRDRLSICVLAMVLEVSQPTKYARGGQRCQAWNSTAELWVDVRAYKRSCEHMDFVIKIGRRSTFCAYRALTAGEPISAATAITLI